MFRRFGNRVGVATKVIELLGDDPAFDDVVAICEPVAAARRVDRAEPDSAAPVEYVYLMKSGRHYKIGRSNSAGRRVYEVALQLPEKVELVHTIETDSGAPRPRCPS